MRTYIPAIVLISCVVLWLFSRYTLERSDIEIVDDASKKVQKKMWSHRESNTG